MKFFITSQMSWPINDGCVRKVWRVLHTHRHTHAHTGTQYYTLAHRVKWVNGNYEWACFIIAGRYDAYLEWYIWTLQYGLPLPNGFANCGSYNQLKLRTMGSDFSTQGIRIHIMCHDLSLVWRFQSDKSNKMAQAEGGRFLSAWNGLVAK